MKSHSAITPPINCVILYVKDIPKVAAFYEKFFGMTRLPGATDGWVQLASPSGGCRIALHQAAVSQKSGAAMKLVFTVADVPAFKTACEERGMKWGPVHVVKDLGHEYCNAKDPGGNSISISSRGMKRRG